MGRFVAAFFAGWLLSQPALAGDDEGFTGRWKVVATQSGDEYFIVDLKGERGRLVASVVDPPLFLRGAVAPRVYCRVDGDAIVVLMTAYQGDWVFKGRRPAGKSIDRIPGASEFGLLAAQWTYACEARLERTEADHLAKPKRGEVGDPKDPGIGGAIQNVLGRTRAIAELRHSRYRNHDLEIALDADRDLPFDAATGTRAWSAARLASAATYAGKAELAAEAKARRDKLMAMFAQEERPQVGPLVVEPFAGPRLAGEDRVVLMEQFLSAEGPECIREGLAFDALLSAYEPSELIAIQYHLHTPGPDPMASPDSIARGKFYAVDRTPLVLVDGRRLPRSSPLDEAARRFNQYRRQIDEELKGKRRAAIQLRVRREGDALQISATAERLPGAKRAEPASLRLVLTEDEIPYVSALGVNRYRRVARSMPGGPAGVALTDGRGRLDITLKLNDLRDELQRDLARGSRVGSDLRGEFRGGVPPILLRRPSLIAFVQDDKGDVLHAVILPVPESDPIKTFPPPK